ncbi:MAG: LON peptidase substrate-binding domain-containing protein, partial [Clostridia bacterium]|nr:LON peptidase substrate-binding domain-containing protein [Clostridia bacterium]
MSATARRPPSVIAPTCGNSGKKTKRSNNKSHPTGWLFYQLVSVQEPIEESAGYDALVRFVRRLYEEYADLNPYMGMESVLEVISSDKPGYLADYIAQNSQMEYAVKQQVLEELDPIKRLNKVCTLLSEEMEILRAENKIQEKVKEQLDRNQKDYVLREQLKAIKNELGEGEDAPDGESYEAKIEKLISDPDSKKKLLKDVANLKKYGQNMSESALIRAYLDTVLELPWGKKTKERLDVARASKILDADHYGLDKVKDRILEYIAVRALSPELKNQIICLVG